MGEPFVNYFTAIPRNAPSLPAGYYLDGFYKNTVDSRGRVWLELSQQLHTTEFNENYFYQIYNQVQNTALTEADSSGQPQYEDYICGIVYRVQDLGIILPNQLWRYSYCGSVFFGDITSGHFSSLQDRESKTCNAWTMDLVGSRVQELNQKDSQVVCYIRREYDSGTSELPMKVGMRVPWFLGFNVWESN